MSNDSCTTCQNITYTKTAKIKILFIPKYKIYPFISKDSKGE